MKSLTVEQNLDKIARENGNTFWYAHELSEFLTYKSFDSFKNVVRKAKASLERLDVDSEVEFSYMDINGLKTWKLSRFAVLLCVLHADSKKPVVSQAKVTLASVADRTIQLYELERLEKRQELSEKDTYMTAVAVQQGLSTSKIGLFKDSGYRGMYNMSLGRLKEVKGIKKTDTLYDHMGLLEMSANSFRNALTAESIKQKNLRNEDCIIDEAKNIGSDVRNMVIAKTGKTPESLPIEEKVQNVKKQLKGVRRKMIKEDKK